MMRLVMKDLNSELVQVPPFDKIETLLDCYESGNYEATEHLANAIAKEFNCSGSCCFIIQTAYDVDSNDNAIVKTDVVGTSEAILAALYDLETDLAKVKIVSSGVGGISESDANLAVAVNSIILGFNVRADNSAKKIIEEESVDLTYHSIIYELIDDIKAKLSGLLDPIIREEIVGTAEVLEVFNSPKFGQIAGCMVVEGSVLRSKPVRAVSYTHLTLPTKA